SPLVVIHVVILAGEADSPPGLPSVAALTAGMIGRGTPVLTAADLENAVDTMGATFATAVTPDTTVFTFTCLERDLDQALSLLKTMLLEANFDEREIDAVKRTVFYDRFAKGRDPEFVAERQLFRLLFAGHPYEVTTYTEEAVRSPARRDLEAFYSRYYRPNNAIIVVTGDFSLSAISLKVSRQFNAWLTRDVERPFLPVPVPNSASRVCFVDLPSIQNAYIYVGNIVMPMTSPDYFAWLVLDQVLGGTTSSRLFMNLRESKSYAYYAFSETNFFRTSGIFWARAKVTPEVVYPAVQEILKDLGNLANERLPVFEMEQAKAFLIGNFPLRLETPEELGLRAARILTFNLGAEHWNRYLEAVMLISLERVFETSQRYLLPKPVVVIVGSGDEVVDHLREFETIEVYDSKGAWKQTIQKGVAK
ncbi:MAG: insulinase family protein, partial [Candidatus Aminicenantes bacterium]|nr:insulinase family protein [Candidatus Aminicenantes bacterium]